MVPWLLQLHFINSIGSNLITKHDANPDSKIKSSNHVSSSHFLWSKTSASQHSIFLQIHDSAIFLWYEGVNKISERVTQVLLENQ